MRTRRLVLIVAILVALAAAVCVGGGQLAATLVRPNQRPPAPQEASTRTVRLRALGQVVPGRWAELGFPSGISGLLADVPVSTGQAVEAGEVLARLETTRLELAVQAAEGAVAAQEAALARLQEPPDPEEVSAAEAALGAARAALSALEGGPSPAGIASAKSELAVAQAELERLEALPDPAVVLQARAELERATAALQQAQAAYDQIKDRPGVGMTGQALTLQQRTIDYQTAQAALDLAGRPARPAELAAARARVAAAQASLTLALAGPSESDLAAARSRIADAEAALARALKRPSAGELAAAKAGLAQAKSQLALAQADLEGTVLRAPFAGTIVAVEVSEGEPSGSTAFITLADLTSWQVETLDVDEWLATRIQVGQAVELSLPAFDQKVLHGTVASIAIRAKQAAGSDPFFPVVIVLDASDPELRWGMTVRLDFGEER